MHSFPRRSQFFTLATWLTNLTSDKSTELRKSSLKTHLLKFEEPKRFPKSKEYLSALSQNFEKQLLKLRHRICGNISFIPFDQWLNARFAKFISRSKRIYSQKRSLSVRLRRLNVEIALRIFVIFVWAMIPLIVRNAATDTSRVY